MSGRGTYRAGMSDYFAGDPRSHRERMLAGDPYTDGDPDNARLSRRAIEQADAYHRTYVEQGAEAARPLLADLLGTLGEGTHVKPPLYLDYGGQLHLGARTFVNYGLVALDVVDIRIGEDCQIGPNVQLLAPTHPLEPQPRRDKIEAGSPITIGDNVWLGGGVIVCPGVSIGDDSVIGAGAVVTTDIPAGVVAVGNPARVVRELDGRSHPPA